MELGRIEVDPGEAKLEPISSHAGPEVLTLSLTRDEQRLVTLVLAGPGQSTTDRTAAVTAEIERIVGLSGAEVSVIYQPLGPGARPGIALRPDVVYHAASTMKVPVMIELFRRIDAGTLKLDDTIVVSNVFHSIVDGSEYTLSASVDSDGEVYKAIGSPMSYRALCEAMITVSSNLATNVLIEKLGAAKIQATVMALGAGGMKVLRGVEDQKAFDKGMSNETTARGLSTLLEAIAWALYGGDTARGGKDSIRFSRAAARAQVRVELEFELGGHRYRVVRGLTMAELYLDGGEQPIANSATAVGEMLQRRLGMSRAEFFNTYFTGQKELAVMASLTATERAQFLSRVLGYERLRVAQERAEQHLSPWTAWMIPTAFGFCMIHFGAIVLDSTFRFNWQVAKLPVPYDAMEWSIVMAVIGVAGIAPTVRRIFGK